MSLIVVRLDDDIIFQGEDAICGEKRCTELPMSDSGEVGITLGDAHDHDKLTDSQHIIVQSEVTQLVMVIAKSLEGVITLFDLLAVQNHIELALPMAMGVDQKIMCAHMIKFAEKASKIHIKTGLVIQKIVIETGTVDPNVHKSTGVSGDKTAAGMKAPDGKMPGVVGDSNTIGHEDSKTVRSVNDEAGYSAVLSMVDGGSGLMFAIHVRRKNGRNQFVEITSGFLDSVTVVPVLAGGNSAEGKVSAMVSGSCTEIGLQPRRGPIDGACDVHHVTLLGQVLNDGSRLQTTLFRLGDAIGMRPTRDVAVGGLNASIRSGPEGIGIFENTAQTLGKVFNGLNNRGNHIKGLSCLPMPNEMFHVVAPMIGRFRIHALTADFEGGPSSDFNEGTTIVVTMDVNVHRFAGIHAHNEKDKRGHAHASVLGYVARSRKSEAVPEQFERSSFCWGSLTYIQNLCPFGLGLPLGWGNVASRTKKLRILFSIQ